MKYEVGDLVWVKNQNSPILREVAIIVSKHTWHDGWVYMVALVHNPELGDYALYENGLEVYNENR